MSTDELLSGVKWRCKICMVTINMIDGGASDFAAMEKHVKHHRAIMTGSNDPGTANMNWRKFIEPVT